MGACSQMPGAAMKIVELTYRYDAEDAATWARPADAQQARERLDSGNRSFAELLDGLNQGSGFARRLIPVDPRDLGLVVGDEDAAPAQRPFAAVLGCSDARVPIEMIFSEGPNDLFVVRVAGNGLGSEVLGSLRYAVDHLGGSLKLVVVLGHSGCGAVTAAVDVFISPQNYLSLAGQHALRGILDKLVGVVHAAARRMQLTFGHDVTQRSGYRDALIEASIVINAALAAYTVQHEIGDTESNAIRASYGVYLLSTRQIWAPRGGSGECTGLADPPADPAAFGEFVDAVVRSERIAALLKR
jgi:carbonic anhydrase